MSTTAQQDMFTTGDGARLRVVEEGPEQAPVTVVFLHGWTLTRHTWDRAVARLAETAEVRPRTIRFDLRGHGESDPAPRGTATIRQCADDLAELIDRRVPTGEVVLVGHSMGGMAIMALAEQHPALFAERVAGVALVATSAGDLAEPDLRLPKPVAALANRVERAVRPHLAKATGRRLARRSSWLRPGLRWLLFGSDPVRADIAATAEWVAACNPANMAAYRESLAEHDRLAALRRLGSKPVVLLAGTADRLTPRRHAERIAAALPEAKFLLYGGAGHMLPLEREPEVTRQIAELVRLSARQAA